MLLVGMSLCARAQIRDTLIISQSDVTIELDDQDFHHVKYGDEYVTEEGAPELPIVTKQYYIPHGATDVELTAVILNEQQIEGQFNIYPSQGLVPISQVESPFIALDEEWSNVAYPSTVAKIVNDSRIFGYRIMTISYHPFVYDIGTGMLTMRNIVISLNYTMESMGVSETLQSSYRKNKCKEYIQSIVENPEILLNEELTETVSTYSRDVPIRLFAEGRPIPDFIIITNEELKPAFKPLAEWKTRRGIFTVIETTEYIDSVCPGIDLCEKIRNYIREKEECWGEGLAILLGGGIDIIPARYFEGHYGKQVTDMYYVDRKFHLPNELAGYASIDIGSTIGRMPVDNLMEAELIVSKQLDYEAAKMLSVNYDYINNTLFANGFNKVGFKNNSLAFIGGGMSTYYKYKNDYPQKNHYFMFDFFNQGKYVFYQGKNYILEDYQQNIEHGEELTRAGFVNALLNGYSEGYFHVVFHDDHSTPSMMGTSWTAKNECVSMNDIKTSNFPQGYYQIILSKGCHPADFEVPSIAKEFLVKPNGGAVAFLGNTDVGYVDDYSYISKFCETMYSTFNKWDWQSHIGRAWLNIIASVDNSKSRLNILGDPTLAFWTDKPLQYDNHYELSGQFLRVVRPNELVGKGSTICVYKPDEVYLIDTLCARREMTFYLTDIKTSGYVYITSTGLVEKPQIDSFYIEMNQEHLIDIENVMISSAISGNRKELFTPGETVCIDVECINTSNQEIPVLPISVSNMNDSQEIQILNYRDTIYSLSPGEKGECSFRVKVLPGCFNMTEHNRNGVQLAFYENINHCYLGNYAINIQSPQLKIEEISLFSETTTNYELFLYYSNSEKNSFIGEGARLISNSANISVLTPLQSINNAALEGTNSHYVAFDLKCTSNVCDSDSLTLELTDIYNNTYSLIVKPFTPTPAPPTERDIELIPGDSYVDIKGDIYAAYYKSINGKKFSSVSTSYFSGPYFRHSGLEHQTTYYYKFMGKKNGKISELSDAMAVSTNSRMLKGFPKMVENTSAFRGSVNCYDIDLDGKKEILSATWDNIDGNGSLIAVKYSGKDFCNDLDSNVINSFARTEGNFKNNIAVGELFDDGDLYIVSSTCNENSNASNSVYCYKVVDGDNDGELDLYWKLDSTLINSPRSPIIADLDGDDINEIIVPSVNNVTVFEADGTIRCTIYCSISYKHLAVANVIPNSIGKQMLIPNEETLAIYDSDGSYLSEYSVSLSNRVSTPVVCDYDNDGYKEAIVGDVFEHPNPEGVDTVRMYAIRYLAGKTSLDSLYGYHRANMIEGRNDVPIAVGDLDNDGYVEIVSNSYNKPYIYSKAYPHNPRPINLLGSGNRGCHETPIIADVNGDDTLDIVLQQIGLIGVKYSKGQGYVTAVNYRGEYIDGVVLQTFGPNFDGLLAADIDNNGRVDLISGTGHGRLYIWETKGNPSKIAWGTTRGNPQNTGEYVSVSNPELKYNGEYNNTALNDDLYVMGNSVRIGQTLTFDPHKKIVVWKNGILNVDGATLNNARIVVKPGGRVNITNGATVNLRNAKSLVVPKGAQLKITKGNILN